MRVRGGGRAGGGYAATLAVGALVAAGCSGGGDPQATVEQFLHALGDKDTDRACGLLASAQPPYRPLDAAELALCASGLRAAVVDAAGADDLAALRTATVTGSEVGGDTAVVRATQLQGVPAAYRSDLALVRVDGQWYLRSSPND
ncbi:MAG: hypothetical protein V9F82_08425 [Dermatophilaceae bacterium]